VHVDVVGWYVLTVRRMRAAPMPVTATFPIPTRGEPLIMNAERVREAAGRQIEVLFGDEDRALLLELGDGNEADAVAGVLVDCLEAPSFDDAEGRAQAGLQGLDGTVRRAP
jgi:hypothetical protein